MSNCIAPPRAIPVNCNGGTAEPGLQPLASQLNGRLNAIASRLRSYNDALKSTPQTGSDCGKPERPGVHGQLCDANNTVSEIEVLVESLATIIG